MIFVDNMFDIYNLCIKHFKYNIMRVVISVNIGKDGQVKIKVINLSISYLSKQKIFN